MPSRTHGMSSSLIYKRWCVMRRRCYDKNFINYSAYGGKGIKVCWRWHSFENFYADMGDVPEGCFLDRIDGKKGYSPSNCRWASRKQQNSNRKNVVYLTWNGVTKHIDDWIRYLNLLKPTIQDRIYRGHWPLEEALGLKPHKYKYKWKRLNTKIESTQDSHGPQRIGG